MKRSLLVVAFLAFAQAGHAQDAEGDPEGDPEVSQQAGVLAAISDAVHVSGFVIPEEVRSEATTNAIAALTDRARRCVGDAQDAWTFAVVVRRSGRVRTVTLEDSEPRDAGHERRTRCLERTLRTLRLERRSGGDVTLKLRVARPSNMVSSVFAATGDDSIQNALGSLRGGSIGGAGGLGARGTGVGGGGTGAGTIGLGNVGTAGRGSGSGTVSSRASRPRPQIRPGQATVTGSLPREVIRRIVRRNYAAIRYCYERELLREPSLEGRVVLQFVIDGAGVVTTARVAHGASLQNASVHGCLVRIVRRWRFPAPDGGGTVTVSYPFIFRTTRPEGSLDSGMAPDALGGEAASPPPRPSGQVRGGNAEVRGSLSREVIRRVIRRHINEARYCYESRLTRDPNLAGTIKVTFTIGANGRVQAATLQEDGMSDAAVGRCLVSVVRRWRFPEPEGGGIVVVNYPFVFRPR